MLPDSIPSRRNKRWPFWLERVAQDGLYDGLTIGDAAREMAVFLLFVELYDHPDRVERTIELLTHFAFTKHNECIHRSLNHPDLPRQIKRCVQHAQKQTADSKQQFALWRQNRQQGFYAHNIMLEPLLSGQASVTPHTGRRRTLGLKCIIKETPLPTQMEAQITQLARKEKMRQHKGLYPVLRFARPFLRAQWDNQGTAEINREACLAMSGVNNPNVQLRYKKFLVRAGLLQDGWERTIRRGQSAATYKLTDAAMAMFQSASQRATG
jgi:hypothetical protein